MAKPLVSEDLWRRVLPLLPRPSVYPRSRQYAGRRPADSKKALAGIIFVLRTGVPWEHLPATSEWPSGYTCRRRLRQWQAAGVFDRLRQELLDELAGKGLLNLAHTIVDSGFIRAPHGGAATGPSPVDRRKIGSKHHILVEGHGVPLTFTLTGANRNDITQLLDLVDLIPPIQGQRGRPRHRPGVVQGDRGYDSEPHRQTLKKKGSSHC